MNNDSIKIELIDWIAHLNDHQSINEVMTLKNKLNVKRMEPDLKLFGSGKHLIEYIAADFNDPLDEFKEYQK